MVLPGRRRRRNVAKTISAYDMSVSDSLYGPAKHNVSRERLEAMLRLEFAQLLERLGPSRGDTKRFFASPTPSSPAATGNPAKDAAGSGPISAPSARGTVQHHHSCSPPGLNHRIPAGRARVLGVNLIHAAFLRRASIADLIDSLMDEMSRERIDIDRIKLTDQPCECEQSLGEPPAGGARADRRRNVHGGR